MTNLQAKVVVITGASAGIGKAVMLWNVQYLHWYPKVGEVSLTELFFRECLDTALINSDWNNAFYSENGSLEGGSIVYTWSAPELIYLTYYYNHLIINFNLKY